MAKKKPNKYKPFRMIRMPEPLASKLKELADRRFSTITEQAKQAALEYLERTGRPI